MKVAVVGKGGAGKTTTSAVIARTIAQSGLDVVALDCDLNPNLGISLGVGEVATERLLGMREALNAGDEEHAPTWDELLARYGSDAPDGVRLAVVSAIENPNPGCMCCGLSPEQLLDSIEMQHSIVVADFEAGVGTLTRVGEAKIDVLLIVVEATPKSIEVAQRAAYLAVEKADRVVLVVNRVASPERETVVRAAFPDHEVVIIPDDPAIVMADRLGVAPLDLEPGSPAVLALAELGRSLAPAGLPAR